LDLNLEDSVIFFKSTDPNVLIVDSPLLLVQQLVKP
jgi:hypothetical protein